MKHLPIMFLILSLFGCKSLNQQSSDTSSIAGYDQNKMLMFWAIPLDELSADHVLICRAECERGFDLRNLNRMGSESKRTRVCRENLSSLLIQKSQMQTDPLYQYALERMLHRDLSTLNQQNMVKFIDFMDGLFPKQGLPRREAHHSKCVTSANQEADSGERERRMNAFWGKSEYDSNRRTRSSDHISNPNGRGTFYYISPGSGDRIEFYHDGE